MKCLINLKKFLYILIRLCIFKLLIHNVFAFKTPSPIVRHQGTCTYQQSQSACTFSLLCYLAGGLPIEGCGTGETATCCVLQNLPNVQQLLDYSKLTNDNLDKLNVLLDNNNLPSINHIPSSSTTYADQPDTDLSTPTDSLSTSKNPNENSATESSLINDSNKYSNDGSTLHSSSSSLSTSTNPYDSISGYQTHQIHHTPRSSLYPPISHPSSLQYHHRLQHSYTSATANSHHLNHQKQHQQNLYLHQQRLAAAANPFYHHSHSVYHSPYSNLPPPSSNARSFHLSNRYNNPLVPQYQPNYFLKDLNDNINYYGDSSSYLGNDQPSLSYSTATDHQLNNFNLNDQNANPHAYHSPLSDLSPPNPANPTLPSPSNSFLNSNNEPDNIPSYLNDYTSPPQPPSSSTSSVPSSSSLLSTYSPTQTIDYKTYQKHTVNPSSSYANDANDHQPDNLHFPSHYSTSSTSSYESTTNHTNLYNSNKIYGKPDYSVEPPASIKYYKSPDYEPTTSYNNPTTNTQPDDNPTVNSDEDARLINNNNNGGVNGRLNDGSDTALDSGRLNDEDEYNNNAIRRSRLASSSPLNSVNVGRETHPRNFIGEDICGKPISKPKSRIIGGQDAFYAEFPWMVHIKIAKHQCGGALISANYIITAAHCVFQAPLDQLVIIIGAHDIESHNSKYYDEIPQHHSVESVYLHPNFRFSAAHPDRFDLALLKLKRPALYTNSVRPICLPPRQLKLEGWRAIVTGWGSTNSQISNRYGTRILQKVDVPIIKNSECEEWHQTRGIDLKIFSEMMCAGYEDGQKDACVGDSGGPLVIFLNGRYTLAGITSAGFGCASALQPGIYHRVSYTIDWILDQINNNN